MIIGVVKETFAGERRVALVPGELPRLAKKGNSLVIEAGAGQAAGYPDAAYTAKGATVLQSRAEVLAKAEVLAQVRSLGANPAAGESELSGLKKGLVTIGFLDPLGQPQLSERLAQTGVSAFAMELIPRITRAQAMDALSSQANLAGYKAVLIAASALPRIFPMMMTAAGTVSPAKVFVIGAGVAGLQAIATAKRLGAVVEAYDVRPEVKDQVTSVGGKFVELSLETGDAGDQGGYAKAQSKEFYEKQQELMASHVRSADVIITTAAVPGRKAPVLVTEAMLVGSKPGAVLVDLAAETGGNCALTQAGETVEAHGVTIMGPSNVPSTLPYHASQLYARNLSALIDLLSTKDGQLSLNLDDEIISGSLVCHEGKVVHPRVQQALGASEQEKA